VFADAPEAVVLRFDDEGELDWMSEVMHPGSDGMPECVGMDVASNGEVWLLTHEAGVSRLSWIHRIAPNGSIASTQLPDADGESWISGPSAVQGGGAAIVGGWRGATEGAGAGTVAHVDETLEVRPVWTDNTGLLGPVHRVVAAEDGGVIVAAREKATVEGDAYLFRLDMQLKSIGWNDVVGTFGVPGEPNLEIVLSDGDSGALVAITDKKEWILSRRKDNGAEDWEYEMGEALPGNGLAIATDDDFILIASDSTEDGTQTRVLALSDDAEKTCAYPDPIEFGRVRVATRGEDDGEFVMAGEKLDEDGDFVGVWLAQVELQDPD
jgi:hypothetical protein